ncbi:TorF family putative porin [Ferrimonas sp.]|uniref:TorF family putative porin n=1 Tax=Ferrimonas sp. TaxID=2080861 RepID=UPI003A928FF0
MKKIIVLTLPLVSLQVSAQDIYFSGYMMGVSNYLWRGQSLSMDEPSWQSSLTVSHELGLYAGVSYETYRYDDGMGGEVKDYETDYYVGYYQSVSDELGIGISALRYTYGDGGDTQEYTLTVDYNSTNATVNYDEDYKAWYGEINQSFAILSDATMVLHAGLFWDSESYGYENSEFYDVAVRFNYPILENLELMLEASYQEFEDDNYLFGFSYNF